MTDRVRAIADAVLYEGYVLWPYRRGALKNQRRWTFGGVYPSAHGARHPDDRAVVQAQALVEGDDPEVGVTVRFLHVVHRQAMRGGEPVDCVEAGGERYLTWEEAVERELAAGVPAHLPIAIAAGAEREPLAGDAAIVRSWRALAGTVETREAVVAPGLRRVTVRVANTSPLEGVSREAALKQTFCSTHMVLRVTGGAFVSLTDPPPEHAEAAAACDNVGVWPVLAGPPGDRSTVLASPIILADHPEIAPESAGDLFDGGEIDQMLVLNILAMTEEERREMRDCDPRTREILERTEALSPEEIMRLHGTIREWRLSRR